MSHPLELVWQFEWHSNKSTNYVVMVINYSGRTRGRNDRRTIFWSIIRVSGWGLSVNTSRTYLLRMCLIFIPSGKIAWNTMSIKIRSNPNYHHHGNLVYKFAITEIQFHHRLCSLAACLGYSAATPIVEQHNTIWERASYCYCYLVEGVAEMYGNSILIIYQVTFKMKFLNFCFICNSFFTYISSSKIFPFGHPIRNISIRIRPYLPRRISAGWAKMLVFGWCAKEKEIAEIELFISSWFPCIHVCSFVCYLP